MFVVMCKVSGGVTGTRESVLKSNGVERRFDTFEEARVEAQRLRTEMNHSYSVADFQYWVEER